MTKTAWAELTPKAQWDIQVAMRGPDCQNSEGIKWLTTGVIRWAMHTVMRVGGSLNEDLKIILVPNDCYTLDKEIRAKTEDKTLSWSPAHFFQHVIEAAHWLGITAVPIPNEVYLQAVRQSQPAMGLYVIWVWANEGSGDNNPYESVFHSKVKLEVERHLEHQFGITPEQLPKLKKGVAA